MTTFAPRSPATRRPHAVEFVEALPKTSTGKVQKGVLRERARGDVAGSSVHWAAG